MTVVETPRANANEDQLQVIAAFAFVGQAVEEGDLLFVLETTKAAVDILAPHAGVVRALHARVGDFVNVGQRLCEIDEGEGAAVVIPEVAALPSAGVITISAKARKVARQLGIAIESVPPSNGRVVVADVRSAVAARRAPDAPQPRRTKRWATSPIAPRRAVIVGGGGHAACLIEALGQAGFETLGCLDGAIDAGTPVTSQIDVIGDLTMLATLKAEGVEHAFVGVGGADDSTTRRRLYEQVTAEGFQVPPVVHPDARIGTDVRVGKGCHILAGATIGARTTIGENVIVNQGSIVCHDCTIHDHAHIAPGAILAGNVTVGPRSVVGMGVTVLLGTVIGADCLIHNGAQIVADLEDGTIVDAAGRRSKRPPVAEA